MIPVNPDHQSVLHEEIYSQPSVMRYAGTGKSYTQEEFSERIAVYLDRNQCLQRNPNTGCLSLFTWTILTQDGIAGRLNIFPKDNKTELAYCISPKQQGRGLARRASELVIGHLNEETALIATVHPDNLASSKTLEGIRYPDGGFVFFRDPAKQKVPGVYGPNQPRDFFESKNQTCFTFFSFYKDRIISVDSSNTLETTMKNS